MTIVISERPGTGRIRVQTLNEQESKTVQADSQRADLRTLLAQYEATGVMASLENVDLAFRDVSEFEDYRDMMTQLKSAENDFNRLPPEVRIAFENDVSQWLDAAHDGLTPAQADRLAKAGVLEIVEKPIKAAPAPEVPAPSGEE